MDLKQINFTVIDNLIIYLHLYTVLWFLFTRYSNINCVPPIKKKKKKMLTFIWIFCCWKSLFLRKKSISCGIKGNKIFWRGKKTICVIHSGLVSLFSNFHTKMILDSFYEFDNWIIWKYFVINSIPFSQSFETKVQLWGALRLQLHMKFK